VSDDTLSDGRCKFSGQEFRSSEVQEWWSGLLVNTAAVWGIYLSLGIKVHHYPK
jgi:hypothetical protein